MDVKDYIQFHSGKLLVYICNSDSPFNLQLHKHPVGPAKVQNDWIMNEIRMVPITLFVFAASHDPQKAKYLHKAGAKCSSSTSALCHLNCLPLQYYSPCTSALAASPPPFLAFACPPASLKWLEVEWWQCQYFLKEGIWWHLFDFEIQFYIYYCCRLRRYKADIADWSTLSIVKTCFGELVASISSLLNLIVSSWIASELALSLSMKPPVYNSVSFGTSASSQGTLEMW